MHYIHLLVTHPDGTENWVTIDEKKPRGQAHGSLDKNQLLADTTKAGERKRYKRERMTNE